MDSAPSSCTTSSGLDVQPLEGGTGPQLPVELIQQILDDVGQQDLRAFALASRASYAHARDAGLCIRRNVVWKNVQGVGFGNSLQQLDLVLDHAAEQGPYLNVAISARMFTYWNDAPAATAFREAMQLLVPSLLRALPNLVQLELPFADFAALSAEAAPKLRALTVYRTGTDGPVFIPSNLFAGIAPKLRNVALYLADTSPMTAWQPIAAFDNVTYLKLTAESVPQHLPLALLFRALRVLVIDAFEASGMQAIDLCGLSLRHFAWSGDARLLTAASAAALKDVPVVEHGALQFSRDPSWPVPCGQLCAVAVRHGDAPTITIGPRDGAWRRSLLPTQLREGALPLADLPILATNLVSMTIEESLAVAFVQTPIVLDELRELVLDVSKPRDPAFPLARLWKAVPCVRCPRLARVVLLGVRGASPVLVSHDPAVRLGHTLGLRKACPALILAGSAWTPTSTPQAIAQIPQLFQDVQHAGAAAICAPEYYDTFRFSGYLDSSE